MAENKSRGERPRVDMITAVIPPYLGGIPDFSANMATGLSRYADLRVLLGWPHWDPLPGVRVESAFSRQKPLSVGGLIRPMLADPPDWVIVQYDPDTIVERGVTPLPLVLGEVKRRLPGVRIATMVHEWLRIGGAASPKERLHRSLLTWQANALLRLSDIVFTATAPWARVFEEKFPHARVVFSPVGSMIPDVAADRAFEKARLGVPAETLTVGLFGRFNRTADPDYILRALRALSDAGQTFLVVYTGAYREDVDRLFGSIAPVYPRLNGVKEEAASMEEVSRRFAATDIFLLPDRDGVSARRTRLMTSLSHGVATVATASAETDERIRKAHGEALLLASHDDPETFADLTLQLARDDALRERIGRGGLEFYGAHYSWERIYTLWAETLGLQKTGIPA